MPLSQKVTGIPLSIQASHLGCAAFCIPSGNDVAIEHDHRNSGFSHEKLIAGSLCHRISRPYYVSLYNKLVGGWAYPSEKWWNSSVGMKQIPIYGKIKTVWNHQPDIICSFCMFLWVALAIPLVSLHVFLSWQFANGFLVNQMNWVISVGLPPLPRDKQAMAAPNIYIYINIYILLYIV